MTRKGSTVEADEELEGKAAAATVGHLSEVTDDYAAAVEREFGDAHAVEDNIKFRLKKTDDGKKLMRHISSLQLRRLAGKRGAPTLGKAARKIHRQKEAQRKSRNQRSLREDLEDTS